MSDCNKNEVYPSKLAKMSEFRHIFSQATLWVDIAFEIVLHYDSKDSKRPLCKRNRARLDIHQARVLHDHGIPAIL